MRELNPQAAAVTEKAENCPGRNRTEVPRRFTIHTGCRKCLPWSGSRATFNEEIIMEVMMPQSLYYQDKVSDHRQI